MAVPGFKDLWDELTGNTPSVPVGGPPGNQPRPDGISPAAPREPEQPPARLAPDHDAQVYPS